MTPIESASVLASAIVLLVGVPVAYFHSAIARELRHLRAHLSAHHRATRHAARRAAGERSHRRE